MVIVTIPLPGKDRGDATGGKGRKERKSKEE